MIEFQGVSRSYGAKLAVAGVDLSIERGELFAMLGQNGAGKTTSIKMMVGLLQPGSGTVRIGGRNVVAETRLATSQIGYVPDQPFLYDKLTGREFLRFVAEMHGLSPTRAQAAVAREAVRFGLIDFMDELTESYSHGMKQRTVFASALLHEPTVLIVDEPMVGLDPQSIRLVKDMLRSQADAGVSVFMSTHTLAAAEEIADKIGVMKRGKLLFVGSLAELRTHMGAQHATLESLYLSLTADTQGVEPTASL